MRIGEATTPGPALGPVLGNINPTGLMGKSNDVAQLPVGVYAVQETHLTGPGITKFRQELAWRKSQYNLCHGAPAPPKNSSLRTIGGKHTGVGFLSSFPCRSITNEWSPEDFQTGRCLAAAAYVQSRWINLGTVYGYSENRQAVQVQQNTGRLLEGLTKRIVDGATGLRMISGDWNLPREQIPQADYWEAKGWMEAQQLAAIKWNRPAQATCKRTTVRDYVYLSPEVIPYVIDVQLDWSYFTDHAVIQVHLSDLAKPPKVPMWRKPAPLPWPKLEQQPEWNQHAQPSHDMDQWYKSVWENMEEYAKDFHQKAGQSTPQPRQLGRATTVEVKWVRPFDTPVKPNRKGDIQSKLTANNLQHSRWTKQVRRLQHYARFASAASEPCAPDHKANLWRSILQATGFTPGFGVWWSKLYKNFANSPAHLPTFPPNGDVANAIFLEFVHHYRELEYSIQQSRMHQAVERRAKDPLLIYRDLQRERAEPVQTIVVQQNIPILHEEPRDQQQLEMELAHPMPEGLHHVEVQGIPTNVQVVDPTHVIIPEAVAKQCNGNLVVKHVIGDVPQILDQFEKEWSPRWKKHDHLDPTTWDTILDFMRAAFPLNPQLSSQK